MRAEHDSEADALSIDVLDVEALLAAAQSALAAPDRTVVLGVLARA